jgi:subtilisin family serine protease
VNEAVARGVLLVASSGNDGDRGNTIGYPAAFPHVTTVAATERSGAVASFSSRSPYVDISAPGADIPVASAIGRNWEHSSGTSFSSPLVAGAAAWIWTVRPELTAAQVAEILRRSARDIGAPGRDSASGFGILDVGAALAYATPIKDPYEPNDDIDQVNPAGDNYLAQAPPLTTATRRTSRVAGRVDLYEDPRDVFRVWLPANGEFSSTLTASANADLALFSSSAPTVSGRFATTGRLASAATTGNSEHLRFRNPGRGRWGYVVVKLPGSTSDATYTLKVTSGKLPV